MAAAGACELCPTVETVSGALRFWAMKAPDAELSGSVLLVGQGGGSNGGGGSYTLPTATASRLGGVKIGDGVNVEEDGMISVDGESLLENATTTEEEVEDMLDEVFGGTEAEAAGE